MNDLAIVAKTQLVKTLTMGSLFALVNARKSERKTFLLIDCSYSMNDPSGAGYGSTKIDALRLVVGGLRREGITAPLVGFGLEQGRGPRSIQFVESVPNAVGSTPLTEAIQFAQAHGAGHLIVISDGLPDNSASALAAASQFGGPIDGFFVGSRPSHGEEFLRQLALASGGKMESLSLADPKQLANSLKGLLSA